MIESCNILTTEANELMKPIHHRMPVILPPRDHETWLDPEITSAEPLTELLLPFPAEQMIAHPVDRRVNRPTHDAPDCIEPAPDPGEPGDLFGGGKA